MDTTGRSYMIITWEWKGLESGGGEKGEKGHSFEWVVCLIYRGVGAYLGVGAYWSMGTYLKKFGMLSSL